MRLIAPGGAICLLTSREPVMNDDGSWLSETILGLGDESCLLDWSEVKLRTCALCAGGTVSGCVRLRLSLTGFRVPVGPRHSTTTRSCQPDATAAMRSAGLCGQLTMPTRRRDPGFIQSIACDPRVCTERARPDAGLVDAGEVELVEVRFKAFVLRHHWAGFIPPAGKITVRLWLVPVAHSLRGLCSPDDPRLRALVALSGPMVGEDADDDR